MSEENLDNLNIEDALETNIYDSGEVFHHHADNNAAKEIPLKLNSQLANNKFLIANNTEKNIDGSSYFRQNHQIVEKSDSDSVRNRGLIKEKQKQLHRQEQYEVIKEYRKKLLNGQVQRIGSDEDISNKTDVRRFDDNTTEVHLSEDSSADYIENLYDAADDSAAQFLKKPFEDTEGLYAKAGNLKKVENMSNSQTIPFVSASNGHFINEANEHFISQDHMNAKDPDDLNAFDSDVSNLYDGIYDKANVDFTPGRKFSANPNVSYTSKGIEEPENTNEDEGVTTLSHEEVMDASSIYQLKGKQRKGILEKKNSVYLRQSRQKEINQTTNLNNLIFTDFSSNVKRSTLRERSPLNNNNDFPTHSNLPPKKELFAVDNTGRESVARNKKFLMDEKNFRNEPRFQSTKSDPGRPKKETTTILLPDNWSGKHVSQFGSSHQVYDYDIKLVPTYSGEHGKNLTGLTFRNSKPIKDVRSLTSDNEAVNSLKNLDTALKNEVRSRSSSIQPGWLGEEDMTEDTNGLYYRQTKCQLSELQTASELISNIGEQEGMQLRTYFYEDLSKILDVLNMIMMAVPKEIFPFEFKPLTIQGEFEKRGQHSIDIYMTLNGFNSQNSKIMFLTLKNQLKAFVTLNFIPEDEFKKFCVFNKTVDRWCLSSSSLMVTFIYVINAKLRGEFESASPSRRRDIPHGAELFFTDVSESNLKLFIKLPNRETKYMIGLKLVLDILDYPQIFSSTHTWPKNSMKNQLIRNGVHLVANLDRNSSEKWSVSFLKSRKLLLGDLDDDSSATTILLTLQVLSNRNLQVGKQTILIPLHMAMTLFWIFSKNPKEGDKQLSERFFDIVIALRQSLIKHECLDFFQPMLNHFASLQTNEKDVLIQKISALLDNPLNILKSLYMHSQDVT